MKLFILKDNQDKYPVNISSEVKKLTQNSYKFPLNKKEKLSKCSWAKQIFLNPSATKSNKTGPSWKQN